MLIYSGEYLSNPNILPIKYIKVEGKLSRLSQTELKDTVENNIRGGFFHLNANEVRLALLDIPWVREVSIKRIYSNFKILNIDKVSRTYNNLFNNIEEWVISLKKNNE